MLPSMPYCDAWVLQIPMVGDARLLCGRKKPEIGKRNEHSMKGRQIEKPELKIDNHTQPVYYAH